MPHAPIDATGGSVYVRPARAARRWFRGAAVLGTALVVSAAACAGARTGSPLPSERARAMADEARQRGRLAAPVQIVFEWSLRDGRSRIGGRGAARMEPPARARLDLFTENGETAARAALVDDEIRIPPEADRRLVPPPPLLWAALGVFRPGSGAAFLGAEELDGGRHRLRYELDGGDELRYEVGERGSVRRAELARDGRVVERVRVERDGEEGFPVRARYRHLPDVRELRVERESVERVDAHDPEIWNPAR